MTMISEFKNLQRYFKMLIPGVGYQTTGPPVVQDNYSTSCAKFQTPILSLMLAFGL